MTSESEDSSMCYSRIRRIKNLTHPIYMRIETGVRCQLAKWKWSQEAGTIWNFLHNYYS